ncbi:MAG: RsmB/NOP family class I SAM-dependent RNA methyltransferase [Candidatus Diapherotrites archaeon]|uniref:RsmB/NOP family class I SAM-dependent RNA methyltransferase n=1 Tax=Candidatus Iainarchaeum sp. TaxID=3101447 RepID=A0A8T4C800_9ARCH|nr:RsmB/NOP family class I SAM-dependent RNA methyltransferase [Candidatus Diapherotrites archaeon]
MTVFSPRLLERYRELLPEKEDFDSFVRVSKTRNPKTIRTNTLKASDAWVESRLRERNISFEKHEGVPHLFTLQNLSFLLGGMWETQMGFWQPQETASQLPPLVLDALPGEHVLDMAAAPGNKTIQLASGMQNTGVLVACEPNKERAKALRFVLGKAGVVNAGVALQDSLTLPDSLRFDKILLDAPCSGEGLLRKKPQTLKSWSEKYVQHKAQLQVKMALKAVALLKEGGTLVYSVCTLSPEECEGVLTTLLHAHPAMKIVPISMPAGLAGRPGLSSFRNRTFSSGMSHAVRLYPQDHNTQSFFIAKLVKGREK